MKMTKYKYMRLKNALERAKWENRNAVMDERRAQGEGRKYEPVPTTLGDIFYAAIRRNVRDGKPLKGLSDDVADGIFGEDAKEIRKEENDRAFRQIEDEHDREIEARNRQPRTRLTQPRYESLYEIGVRLINEPSLKSDDGATNRNRA